MMLLGPNLVDSRDEEMHSGPDPLGNARKDLDFAALAAGAPSVKNILFKAQTMGPLPRTRPGGKTIGGIAAGAALLLMLVTPWVRINSSILSVQMGFEKALSRREAADLFSELLKNEPTRSLLSASFSPLSGEIADAGGGMGHLRVNATAFDTGRAELEDDLRKLVIVHGSGGLEPMFSQVALEESSRFSSPAGLLAQKLSGGGNEDRSIGLGALPVSGAADGALEHSAQIASGLARRLSSEQRSVEVSECRFISVAEAAKSPEAFDFVLSAWPAPLGIKLKPYADLTVAEQDSLRRSAQAYLGTLGLTAYSSSPGDSLVPQAGAWMPVVVAVKDADGRHNAYLSARIQAHIAQPGLDSLLTNELDVEQRVQAAVQRVLPRSNARVIDGDTPAWVDGKRIHVYNAQVYLQAGAGPSSVSSSGFLDEARERLDEAAGSGEW